MLSWIELAGAALKGLLSQPCPPEEEREKKPPIR